MNNRIMLAVLLVAGAAVAASAEDRTVDFAKDVQPILKESCIECHGFNPKKPKKKGAAELRLDDEKLAMKGGRSGKAVIPGDAKDSLLYKLLNGPVPRPDKNEGKDIQAMPLPERGKKWQPLPKDQIETIRLWIDQGAKWSK